jgi:hypothetical protein
VVTNLFSEFMVEQLWKGVHLSDGWNGLKKLKPENRALWKTADWSLLHQSDTWQCLPGWCIDTRRRPYAPCYPSVQTEEWLLRKTLPCSGSGFFGWLKYWDEKKRGKVSI